MLRTLRKLLFLALLATPFLLFQNCGKLSPSIKDVGSSNSLQVEKPSMGLPTLTDLWEDKASFSEEQRVCARKGDGSPEGAINAELDFHYELHDSGMAVIEWPENSGVVYYLAEHHRQVTNPLIQVLEPHLYKSVDGGKTLTLVSKIFELDGNFKADGSCNLRTTPYWELDGKRYCIFQLREADVVHLDRKFQIVYEASGITKDGAILSGIALVGLSDLKNIGSPQVVVPGVNFRQHPLFVGNYSGNSRGDTVSASTPAWKAGEDGIYVFWTGVSPTNSVWARVDTYRGHFTNSPGSNLANCTDPMFCFFAMDEYLISSPNLGIGEEDKFDSKNVDVKSLVSEDGWNYLVYLGGDRPIPNRGVGIARSRGLNNWERKYKNGFEAPVVGVSLDLWDAMIYGKLVKIRNEYYLYYYDMRSIPPGATPIARMYRKKLNWNPVSNALTTERCY